MWSFLHDLRVKPRADAVLPPTNGSKPTGPSLKGGASVDKEAAEVSLCLSSAGHQADLGHVGCPSFQSSAVPRLQGMITTVDDLLYYIAHGTLQDAHSFLFMVFLR